MSNELQSRKTAGEIVVPDPWSYRAHLNGEIACWQPPMTSADNDFWPGMEVNRGRARELALTNPYGSNSAEIVRDAIVGRKFSLVLMPDEEYMGVSAEEADEWASIAEKEWRRYAEGPTFDCDATRKNTWTFMMHIVVEALHVDGEALGILRAKEGGFGYLTCLQLIEPERLDDNQLQPLRFGQSERRFGIERDEYGEPIAYHVRQAHPDEARWARPGAPNDVVRIPRQTATGRPIVLHVFDENRPSMTRGQSRGMLAALKQLKMLGTFSDAALGRAIQQAAYAAVIQSDLQYEQAMMLLGTNGGNTYANNLTAAAAEQLKAVAPYYKNLGLRFNGSKVLHLMPGEELKVIQGTVEGVQFDLFEKAMIRQLAASLNVSYEDLSRDFSGVSYSSARQSMATIWRRHMRQRQMVVSKFCMPFVSAWMEEGILTKRLPMLGKKFKATEEDYRFAKYGLAVGDFISWGKPVIDPVKEYTGKGLAMAYGLSTLRDEAAGEGEDYASLLRQRAREMKLRDQLGLNPLGVDPTLVVGGNPKSGNPQEGRQARSDGPG